MPEELDAVLVLLVIGAAVAYSTWRGYRRCKGKAGCSGGCCEQGGKNVKKTIGDPAAPDKG